MTEPATDTLPGTHAGGAAAVHVVGCGSAVTGAVQRAVAALQADDPFAEVLVLTPPGPTAETLRRRLPFANQGRGVAGVRFTTVVDLAGELLDIAGAVRRPLTPTVLAAFVEAELSVNCPPALTAVRHDPATVRAVVEAAERLRHLPAGTETSADAVADLVGTSRSRRALVDVAGAVRARLRDVGFTDEATTLSLAGSVLSAHAHRLAPIVVVFTDQFAPGQIPFLTRVVAKLGPRAAAVQLGAWADDHELQHQVHTVFRLTPTPGDDGQMMLPFERNEHSFVCRSFPDADEESRGAVRRVVELTTGLDALAPDRIVILVPSSSGYRRSIVDEFARAGLVWSGHAPYTYGESIAGTATRHLLQFFQRRDRPAAFDVFDAYPGRARATDTLGRVARWSRLARQLGLFRERDWDVAVERLEAKHRADRERAAEFGAATDPEREANDHATLTDLLQRVHQMRDTAQQVDAASTWLDASHALATQLEQLLGTENERQRWWRDTPDWQLKAATQLLDQIRALADLDHTDVALPYHEATLARLVADLLERPVGRQGNASVGVRIGSVTDGLCVDADVVLLLGANEGVLPTRTSDAPLAPRSPRSPAARYVEHARWAQHRTTRAWSSLLAGDARLEVSWARSDLRRGGTMYPSRLLVDAQEAGDVPCEPIASHAAATLGGAPLTTAEALIQQGHSEPWRWSPELRRRGLATYARRGRQWSAYEGAIGAQPELDPTARVHAITSFESMSRCGVEYFIRHVLGVRDDTDPAEQESIDALSRGSLVHDVLHALVAEWLALDQQSAWLEAAHLPRALQRVDELVTEKSADLHASGALGHEARWRAERRLLVEAIRAALRDEVGMCTPAAAELSFGMADPDEPPLAVTTSVGEVTFRGSVDRLDLVGANEVRVTDFKTSSRATPVSPLRPNDPTDGGTKLQLPVYALVAKRRHADRAVRVRYLYLRGVHAESSPIPEEAHAQALDDIDRVATRIVNGDFHPEAPHPMWGCQWCAPDGLGLADIERRTEMIALVEQLEQETTDE